MGLQLVSAPTGALATLAEAKLACKVDATIGDLEDDWLTREVSAVTTEIERWLGRSVLSQTWELTLDAFSDSIELPRGPVSEVVSIKYDDADGVEQTLDPSVYALDLTSTPQWVVRASAESWPTLLDAVNAVRVRFVAGQPVGPDLERIKAVCLAVVAGRYDNRGQGDFPDWAKARLRDLRRVVI